MRFDFETELHNMGDNPRFCKIVALSNGNMAGIGQTRYWDGLPRTAGDRLLDIKTRTYVRILGHQFNFFGSDLEMNTDPLGVGTLAKINAGTWWFKIKLKLFGLKVKTGFITIINKDWEADMNGTSTSAGGSLEFTGMLEVPLLINKQYNQNGNWQSLGVNRFGTNTDVGTDGFHWSFVPTNSGFKFGNVLNNNYDNMNVSSMLANEPFDVICGIPGQSQFHTPQDLVQEQFWFNFEIGNRQHLTIRNDSLYNNFVPEFHNTCPNGTIRPIYMLNREIGNDSIVLENRILPWEMTLSIYNQIDVNKRSLYYTYPSIAFPQFTRESVWSKENPYYITSNGKANFKTNPVMNINYYPPITGTFTEDTFSVVTCCENYFSFKKSNPKINTISTSSENIVLFPNPTNNYHVSLRFTPKSKGNCMIQIFDIMGRLCFVTNREINDANIVHSLSLQLPNSLRQGAYIVKTTLNDKTFINKLKIN